MSSRNPHGDKMGSLQSSPIERTPPEIRLEILSYLPDASTLKSAALSCPALFYVVITNEVLLCDKVLRNQIDPELIHDVACLSHISLDDDHRTPWYIMQALLDQYTMSRRPGVRMGLPKFGLGGSIVLSKNHGIVQKFTLDFVKWCDQSPTWRYAGQTYRGPEGWPPGANELRRIMRSFYRFEICRTTLQNHNFGLLSPDQQRMAFLGRFAPWETEQLACVRDYLENSASEGSIGVTHIDLRSSLTRPFYYPDDWVFGRPLRLYTVSNQNQLIPQPVFPDEDPGPERIWRWSHWNLKLPQFVSSSAHIPLRRMGYVMWNLDRLLATGMGGLYRDRN